MKNEKITFKTAKIAKNKGFNKECRFFYFKCKDEKMIKEPYKYGRKLNANAEIDFGYEKTWSAPTQALLQRWLREEYGIHLQIELYIDMDRHYFYNCNIIREMSYDKNNKLTKNYFDYKDNRWRIAKKINKIDIPLSGNTYEKALEAGLKKALEEIKE